MFIWHRFSDCHQPGLLPKLWRDSHFNTLNFWQPRGFHLFLLSAASSEVFPFVFCICVSTGAVITERNIKLSNRFPNIPPVFQKNLLPNKVLQVWCLLSAVIPWKVDIIYETCYLSFWLSHVVVSFLCHFLLLQKCVSVRPTPVLSLLHSIHPWNVSAKAHYSLRNWALEELPVNSCSAALLWLCINVDL